MKRQRQRARASEQQSVYVNIARYNKTQVLADFDARRGKERKRENKPQVVLSKHLKDTKHIPVLFALRARIYIYREREREMTLQT